MHECHRFRFLYTLIPLNRFLIENLQICSVTEKTKTSNSDPLGNALLDYLKGNKRNFIEIKSSLGEEDNLWVKQFFRKFDEMPLVEREALKRCKGKILDVGAGGGAHSLYLKEKGLEINPIDISEGAVESMRIQGLDEAKNQDFFQLSNGKYDTLLFLMNGLGIVGQTKNLPNFFSKAVELLNPGGQIIFDSSDIIYMFEDEDGNFEIDINKYYGEVRYTMTYNGVRGKPFNWLFMDFASFEYHANKNNFGVQLICEQDNFAYSCICSQL